METASEIMSDIEQVSVVIANLQAGDYDPSGHQYACNKSCSGIDAFCDELSKLRNAESLLLSIDA